ncbi:hypothetical protein V2J09_007479 [Rumex salicifolius]
MNGGGKGEMPLTTPGISTKKEAFVNFLTDPLEGRSTLRPIDVLISGWVNGKHACVDLTEVSPLAGIVHDTFTVGQAALRIVSEAVELLKRVQKVIHSNVIILRSMDFVFSEDRFAIQKGLVAQLISRLPAKSMEDARD